MGGGGGVEKSSTDKKSLDFSKFNADSHLTGIEREEMKEMYKNQKEEIIEATKGQLENFIIKDYGEINRQYLGGFEGIVTLQEKLGINPADGSFGPGTFKALIEYQKQHQLSKIDGIAGPETMKKLGITGNINHSSETRRNNSRGGIRNNPSTNILATSIEIPKKDVGKILTSFDIRLKGIQTSLSDNKKYRDENTGFFNVLADDLVNLAGGESGKAIYERNHQRIKDQASETIKNLDANLNGVPLSDTERSQYLKIRSELEKTLGHTLGEPNPFITIKNSVMDIPNTVVNAVKGTAGVVVGTVETTYGAIKGIFDLTIFATRYTSSFIGEYMGVNPDYKNKMDAEIGKIYNTIKGMDFTKEQVFVALSQGFDQIKGDPYAIGKLAGIVVGILLTMKGTGALSNVVRGKKIVAQIAENAAEVATRVGKPAEIAAAKYASKLAKVDAFIWKAGEFILNGPAEIALGKVLSKSFQVASGAIRGGISAKNLKTVEKSIEDFRDAIKNETNPEKLKYLQEAKESLEGEKMKIAKKLEGQADAPKNEIPNKKEFITEGKTNERIYKELQQYYNPTRPNQNHPRTLEIANELSRIKNEMKSGKDVRVKLEAIAKDPDGYLEGMGKTMKNPTEILIDRLSDYEKVYSDSLLRQLAKSDAQEFGLALVNQFHIRQIKELAKVDPALALAKGEAYLKNPKKYLESAYAPPHHLIDNDIKQFAKQAYEGGFKAEGEALRKQYKDAYENWLKNNADIPKGSFEQVQKIMSNFDEVIQLLGNKASEITKNIEEIIDLLKGNIKNNLSEIRTRIDSIIESVRLNQNIGLDIKAKISRKLKEIKESFGMKEKNNSRIEPTIEPQNPTHSKKPETQETPEVKAPKQEKGLRSFNHDEIKNNDLSGDANKFFYDPEIPKPKYRVSIDGKEFLLTDSFGSKKTILGYISVNGKLEPRYFYFSDSGHNWHASPGVDNRTPDGKRRISKGEQWNEGGYTKGTVVSDDLQSILNSIGSDPNGPRSFSNIWENKIGSLDENGLKDSSKFNEFNERRSVDISDSQGMNNNVELDDLKHMYISNKIDLNFKGGFEKITHYPDNEYFGKMEGWIGKTIYNNQPINVVFLRSIAEPHLVWVENIKFSNSPIDSFGIPKDIFNGGLLTAKPAEYLNQVPEYIASSGKRLTGGDNPYVDIRPFLQNNPLVVQFKKLTEMKKAA